MSSQTISKTQSQAITFYNENSIEAMKRYPDNYFDLAIPDPPYFNGPNRRKFYGTSRSTRKIRRVEYPILPEWTVPGKRYFDELFRVSKHQIIWGVNYFKDERLTGGRIIWDKVNGSSTFSDCEIAYCSLHDSVRLFRYMWNGAMQGKSIKEGHIMQGNKSLNEIRINPCQKPVALYEWILSKYAKKGYKILDTHGGSCSLAIACLNFGADMDLNLTAFEINKEMYHLAMERIEDYQRQECIFR